MHAHRFQRQLNQLQGWRMYVFALGLAERGLPNALLFYQLNKPADAGRTIELMEDCWAVLESQQGDDEISASLLERVEALMPDPEDYEGYGVKPAADFFWLLEQAMLSRLNSEKRRGAEVSQRSIATVMDYVEFAEGESMSEDELVHHLDRHPLMRQELSFQQELLESLRRTRAPVSEMVEQWRALSENDGVSNIGISATD